MTILKNDPLRDELKELELIQKELEQARAETRRLWEAKQETLKRIDDIRMWDKEYHVVYKDISDSISKE